MSDPISRSKDFIFEGFRGTEGAKAVVNELNSKYGGMGGLYKLELDYIQYLARKKTFTAPAQAKAPPARAARKLDDSLLTGKKPSADIDKRQQLATPGETIPIVFGKRVYDAGGDIGGVWVQPSMVKAGTKLFVGSFLYAISQGKIVSSPVKYRIWVGPRSLAFIADQAITLEHNYATAADLAAAPDTCPIGGGTLFCGVETYSYLSQLAKAEVGAVYTYSYDPYSYYTTRIITRGVGDTSNTVATLTGNDVFAFNSDDGTDISAAYLAYRGWTFSTPLQLNTASTVGTIYELGTSSPQSPGFLGIPAGARLVIQFTIAAVNTQYNPALPASTGTLYGVQQENIESPYQFIPGTYLQLGTTVTVTVPGFSTVGLVGSTIYIEITSGNAVEGTYIVATTPTANTFTYTAGTSLTTSGNLYLPVTPGADNSAYTDITFLRVEGNIYDPPAEGSYPTTTKQLFIYYEEGVEVDLYSGGLVSSVYPRGASNQLVDLAMYLFTIYKRADAANTADIASPIYTDNLTSIAAFADYYGFFFNGVLEDSVNIIELISDLAPYFFLSFLSVGGQYRFEPVLPLDGNVLDETALTPAATFTEDEILAGSFNKSFYPVTDRQDFIAVMLYRESSPSSIGIQRTIQVSYTTTALDAPVEQFDMTDFCTFENHAIKYAKYELAKRKYSTHTISFETALIVTGLKPTDIIKIDRQRITSAGDNRSEVDWYQISSITFNAEGRSAIEAEHFPVTAGDFSTIIDSIFNDSFRAV